MARGVAPAHGIIYPSLSAEPCGDVEVGRNALGKTKAFGQSCRDRKRVVFAHLKRFSTLPGRRTDQRRRPC
jgi:hypothetical protein